MQKSKYAMISQIRYQPAPIALSPVTSVYDVVKRICDVSIASILLLSLALLMLVLITIKFFEDGHNPFYVSKRVGYKGKIIKFHKIRSMCVDADKLQQSLMPLNEADGPAFKIKDDPRITPFGRFLRKTSLDELPQLWDVVCGRLSLVGPRSLSIAEINKCTPYQRRTLDVKGGLVCYWQLTHNRNSLSFRERIDLDIDYLADKSFKTDLKIFLKAIIFVLIDHSGE